MKKTRMVWLTTVLLVPAVFVSCNDDNDRIGSGNSTVPDSADNSSKSFFDYLFALNMSDESSEPAAIKDGFLVPDDEANEPQPLG